MDSTRVLLAGVTFDVAGGPLARGNGDFLDKVASLPDLPCGEAWSSGEFTVPLEIVDALPWKDADEWVGPPGQGAVVRVRSDSVLVGHHCFRAEIPPRPAPLRLWEKSGFGGLNVTLRVALCCRIPSFGGLPLHASGIVFPEGGLAFFGESGAGKSTLSALSMFPVLSDELVILAPARGCGFRISASGHFGDLGGIQAPRGWVPLRGCVALAKHHAFTWRPLPARIAFHKLLASLMLPASPGLWRLARASVMELLSSTPCFEMAWDGVTPPFEAVRALLEEARAPRSPGP